MYFLSKCHTCTHKNRAKHGCPGRYSLLILLAALSQKVFYSVFSAITDKDVQLTQLGYKYRST